MTPPVMVIDLSALLSWVLASITVATAAGLGLTRGRISSLKEQLEEARAETAAIRTSRAEENAEREKEKHAREIVETELRGELAAVNTELTALRRTVTGEVHWQAILDLTETHHGDALAHWRRQEDAQAALLAAVSTNTEALLAAVHSLNEG